MPSSKKSKKTFKIKKPVGQRHYDRLMVARPIKTTWRSVVVVPLKEELIFALPIIFAYLIFGGVGGFIAAIISGIIFVHAHKANHRSPKEYFKAIPTYAMQAFFRLLIILAGMSMSHGFMEVAAVFFFACFIHSGINATANIRKLKAGHFG